MRPHITRAACVALAAIVPAFVAGCVSLLVHGADSRQGAPSAYHARLVAQNCRLSTGDKVGDPGQTYYLALDQGAPVLIELDARADGVSIHNGWTDDHGQHFFVWISGGPGYEFFFPRDAAQTARRIFYIKGGYQVAQDAQGKSRPVGSPAGGCDLIAAAAPPPAPVPATTAQAPSAPAPPR